MGIILYGYYSSNNTNVAFIGGGSALFTCLCVTLMVLAKNRSIVRRRPCCFGASHTCQSVSVSVNECPPCCLVCNKCAVLALTAHVAVAVAVAVAGGPEDQRTRGPEREARTEKERGLTEEGAAGDEAACAKLQHYWDWVWVWDSPSFRL